MSCIKKCIFSNILLESIKKFNRYNNCLIWFRRFFTKNSYLKYIFKYNVAIASDFV